MSSTASPAGPSPEAIAALRRLINAEGQTGWDTAWSQGVTPWDKQDKQVQLALKELIEEGKYPDFPKHGKALVPGCGTGYDAVYFARLGLDTVGVDISPRAVEVANNWLGTLPDVPSNVTFRTCDFFAPDSLPKGEQGFDLAYDYTFFCAIPPSMRKDWADRYAEVIKPGGLLITLMYPLDGDREGGPPYSVHQDDYSSLLSPNFERVYRETPTKTNHPGKEVIAIWKRFVRT